MLDTDLCSMTCSSSFVWQKGIKGAFKYYISKFTLKLDPSPVSALSAILVPERALQYVGSGKSSCSKLVENAGGVHSLEETRS